jgi:hypothetical protein
MSIVAAFLAELWCVGITAPGQAQELSWAEVARRGRAATALVTLMTETGEKMAGEASAFCVDPGGLFVTNHHAIRGALPPEVTFAIDQSARFGRGSGPTPAATEHIPMAVPAGGPPRIKLVLNSNRTDQKVVVARVLWTDPDWDLALLRAEGVATLPALPIADRSDLPRSAEVAAFGFPLGSALATRPPVNVTRGKVLNVVAKDGKPSEVVAELSINPGNSGGPLLDRRGLVVGVVRARLENTATGKGVSLAIPVSRLEWFLSRPEIALAPRIIARAAANKLVEFKAELKTLFLPGEPVEIELTLRDAAGSERRFPMSRAGATYRAVAVPFPDRKVKPAVSLTLIKEPAPLIGRVGQRVLSAGTAPIGRPAGPVNSRSPGTWNMFQLAEVRRIRLRPTREIEGAFSTRPMGPKNLGRIVGPVTGIDEILAELERQLPNFDPEEVEEIEVQQVSVELSVPGPLGPVSGRVEDRWLICGGKTLRLSDIRRLRLRPVLEVDAVLYDSPRDRLTTTGSTATLKGPITGLDRVLAELAGQVPDFDTKRADEIPLKPVNAECLLTVWRVGTTVASVECDDRDLAVGAQAVRLSGIRRLRLGKFPQVEMARQEWLEGPIAGLDGLLAEIQRQVPGFDPKVVNRILVHPREAPDTPTDTVRCTLVARRAGTIVGRLESEIYAQDPERPTLETLSQGRFIRPHRSLSPVTSLRLRIPEDDRLGRCDRQELIDEFRRCLIRDPGAGSGRNQEWLFEGEGRLAPPFGPSGRFQIDSLPIGHRYSFWQIELRLPASRKFESGDYVFVADDQTGPPRNPIATGAAHFQFGDITKRISYDGRIRVWEIETTGVNRRVAFDFVLRYRTIGDKPGAGGHRLVVGMYRWRSTFE